MTAQDLSSSKWIRGNTEPPADVRQMIRINSKKHPELARFVYNLPHGEGNTTLIQLLEVALKVKGNTTSD